MKSKCLICDKKDSKPSIILTEWIINHKDAATAGKDREVHASCISNKLHYETKEGFIYGKVSSDG